MAREEVLENDEGVAAHAKIFDPELELRNFKLAFEGKELELSRIVPTVHLDRLAEKIGLPQDARVEIADCRLDVFLRIAPELLFHAHQLRQLHATDAARLGEAEDMREGVPVLDQRPVVLQPLQSL